METTIKQAEEERNRCIESVKHLYEDYRPLKEDVDGLRNKIGLDTLPELQEEEDKLTPKYIYGPRREKTSLQGFRQSEIQTSLLSYRD